MTLTVAQWINQVVAVFLPVLVGLVTAKVATPGVKATVLLALAAVSGFLTEWLDALNNTAAFDFSQGLFATGMGFITAVAVHFGFLKPANITGSAGAIQSALPGGFGNRTGGE